MSSEARPIEPEDVGFTKKSLLEAHHREIVERGKRWEEEDKVAREKWKQEAKELREDEINARINSQHIEEAIERKEYYEKFKPVKRFKLWATEG